MDYQATAPASEQPHIADCRAMIQQILCYEPSYQNEMIALIINTVKDNRQAIWTDLVQKMEYLKKSLEFFADVPVQK